MRRGLGILFVVCASLFACGDSGPDASRLATLRAEAASPEREWQSYLGDLASRQWSPLARVDRSNVAQLAVAWTYHSGAPASAGLQMQTNPLVIDGVFYGVSPNLDLLSLIHI